MKYWKARQLSSKKFKRLTGVSPRSYRLMVRLVKDKEAGKKKPGISVPHQAREPLYKSIMCFHCTLS
jgi:hypothetical protein